MSHPKSPAADNEMLPEYDFRGAVRGKYFERYRQGCNVVVLEPDVASVFPNAAAVNRALRLLLTLARAEVPGLPPAPRRKRRSRKPLQRSGRSTSRR